MGDGVAPHCVMIGKLQTLRDCYATLTPRERQVMALVDSLPDLVTKAMRLELLPAAKH
jgi:FixJ family two-component response regulator